jgi:thiamine transport system permease protein
MLVAALVLLPLAAILGMVGQGSRPAAADLAALRFTLMQAAVSAAISVGLAIPAARALARRSFAGRGALVAFLGAPFFLPSVVAVIGIVGIYGQQGLLSRLARPLGAEMPGLYGPQGVILAHVFFNLPLALRMFVQAWGAVPPERLRLAASLGFGPAEMRRHFEWPILRAVAPAAFLTVFLVCLGSFAVALTLGGGPRATTLELAIYQAIRFDFDLGRAALLACIQLGLSALVAGAVLSLSRAAGFGPGGGLTGIDLPRPKGPARFADAALILLVALFLLLPLAAVALRGLGALPDLPAGVWPAALRSVLIALVAMALAVAAAVMLAGAAARLSGRAARLQVAAAYLPLSVSGLVLGTGLFLLLKGLAPPMQLALPVTVLANALAALPFAFAVIAPAAQAAEADYAGLASSLGMAGLSKLRFVTLPLLRAQIGFAAGLSAALSVGDLGVIALFADPARPTLPLYIQQLMGAYRMHEAAGAALVLLLIALTLFVLFDRWGRNAAP